MFDAADYDVIPFKMPISGMNQLVSPDLLQPTQAYFLENIIPRPLGTGEVRHGVNYVAQLDAGINRYRTIASFPYISQNGARQQLLYTCSLTADVSAANFAIIRPREFSFTSNVATKYLKDLRVQVEYTYNGATIRFVDYVTSVTVVDGTITLKLRDNAFPVDAVNPPVINVIYYDSGSIFLFNVDDSSISDEALISGLSALCCPRSVDFADKLFICNGVDKVLEWNGVTLTQTFQWLKESANTFTRISDTQFTFKINVGLFKLANYAVGQRIKLFNNNAYQEFVIANSAINAGVVTLTIDGVLPAFAVSQSVQFQAFPPRFRFMFAMYDRIWALGEGAVSNKFVNSIERMRVYFMYVKGATCTWFNETTQAVPSMNLLETHGVNDNLEAIAVCAGHILFLGRTRTQVWAGTEPIGAVVDPSKSVFSLAGILDTGIVHGDLVVSIANDVFAVTKRGIVSFGTYREGTVQFSVNSINAVDNLVSEKVLTILNSNIEYLGCENFKYNSIAGFKIGNGSVLCGLYDTGPYSWTIFSGIFSNSSAFCSFENSLHIFSNNRVYKYADGIDGDSVKYSDDDKAILFRWTVPVVSTGKKSYKNIFFDLDIYCSSSFVVNENNKISLTSTSFFPNDGYNMSEYDVILKGDVLGTVPLAINVEDTIGMRFSQNVRTLQRKMKFTASKFWLTLAGSTIDGPIKLNSFNLYGIFQRG